MSHADVLDAAQQGNGWTKYNCSALSHAHVLGLLTDYDKMDRCLATRIEGVRKQETDKPLGICEKSARVREVTKPALLPVRRLVCSFCLLLLTEAGRPWRAYLAALLCVVATAVVSASQSMSQSAVGTKGRVYVLRSTEYDL